jgi:hypothetical protein
MRTGRIAGTSSVLLVACGLMAAAPGVSLAARSARRTAVVSGYVGWCGGPAPGRCQRGNVGFCQAPQGCVTTHRVAAVNWNGRRVAVQRLRHGRFSLRLPPGRYTLELLGDGRTVRGRVMERKKVTARAHRTTYVRFVFNVP